MDFFSESGTHPVTILQHLIQYDTINPPGNERECIEYIAELLDAADLECTLFARDPSRPNLVCRLKGEGNASPFLMYGHADVVPVEGQDWTHDPFAADIADGYVWGRGALDMKGGLAMMLAALLRVQEEQVRLPRDILFCVVSDEEDGGEYGAKFLVEEHADLFSDVQYAIGEFGAFTFYVGGRRFYPIMIAEKQISTLKVTFRGPAGHGSMGVQDGAMEKLGTFLTALERKSLPVHVTPAAEAMLRGLAAHLPLGMRVVLSSLTNPSLAGWLLRGLGVQASVFSPLLHNTASPTMVRGGVASNVHAPEVVLTLDGRLLPGYEPSDLIAELREVTGTDAEFEVLRHDATPGGTNMGLYPVLEDVLRAHDPEGIPIPYLLPAVTDGRFFGRLGIQTYGFLPMTLPEDFNFNAAAHAADERIPVDALEFGAEVIYELLRKLQ